MTGPEPSGPITTPPNNRVKLLLSLLFDQPAEDSIAIQSNDGIRRGLSPPRLLHQRSPVVDPIDLVPEEARAIPPEFGSLAKQLEYRALARAAMICVLAWALASPCVAQADPPKHAERDARSGVVSGSEQAEIGSAKPSYPLKGSANGRCLVDQKNVPFLIAGDSPQALIVNLSEADADFYFANRKSHGFNTVWINLLCRKGTGGRKDGTTIDGILPFTERDDVSTPNEQYFARCDRMIRLAAKHDLLVLLDPCETIDHLRLMFQNGVAKCRTFGQYLGTRYETFDNILWMSGNEFEYDSTPAVLRRQEYWTDLSGATGQLYGNGSIWPFKSDWKSKLDSRGAIQMRYVKALFEPRAWYNLVPDQKHTVVTAGYGTFDASTTEANRYVAKSDYVTAGRTPDGRLVMAYMPTLRPLTVDMTKLSGAATARWYDPSRGVYVPVADSPLRNVGERTFTPPGKNGDGDGDWVLVLETSSP